MKRGRASNLPGGAVNMEHHKRRGRGKCLLVATVAIAMAGRADAQIVCAARPQLLGGGSPRSQIADLSLPAGQTRLAQDALGCSADTVRRGYTLRTKFVSIHADGFLPAVRVAVLGGLPDARDNGVMWGGRGTSWMTTAGISLDTWRAHAVFAPVWWGSENRAFRYFGARDSSRSGFASPWYDGAYSLDMPTQFGVNQKRYFGLGESGWWIALPYVDAGLSASTQTWGPGLRAHLLLGPDAPGIPRAFLRTSRPIATRVGRVSATIFRGTLRESPYFDGDPANNLRRLWAWTVELSPGDVMQVAVSHAAMTYAGSNRGGKDGMTTISLRALSTEDAGGVWIELGRMGLPSLRNLLTAPVANLAYVIGFEQATRLGNKGKLLLSAEVVNLEQPTVVEGRATQDFYTSASVSQGWTNRGRLLGVSTGPGSQSQFVALDFVPRHWSLGVFGERVRWNEDVFLREYLAYPNRHDVSLRWGTRFGVAAFGYELDVEASLGKRLNFQFQNGLFIPDIHTADIAIPQLRVTVGRPLR